MCGRCWPDRPRYRSSPASRLLQYGVAPPQHRQVPNPVGAGLLAMASVWTPPPARVVGSDPETVHQLLQPSGLLRQRIAVLQGFIEVGHTLLVQQVDLVDIDV